MKMQLKLNNCWHKSTIFTLQLSFFIIILIQLLKVLLNKNIGGNQTTCTSDKNNIQDVDSMFTYSADYTVNLIARETLNTEDDKPREELSKKLNIGWKNLSLSVSFIKSFDKQHLTLNQTKIIQLANHNDQPILITTTLINFAELLEFKNLNNFLRKTLFLTLSMSCMLVNLLIICYLLHQKRSNHMQNHTFLNDFFLKSHFCLNIFLILSSCLINVGFLVYRTNDLPMKQSESDLAAHILLNTNNKFDSNVSQFWIELDYSDWMRKMGELFSASINIKMNIFLLVLSLILMTLYAFLLQIDYRFIRKRKYRILKIESSDVESPCDKYEELKVAKMNKSTNAELQMILHSLFVIYLLSLKDIADVYYHSRIHEFNPTKWIMASNFETSLAKNIELFKVSKSKNLNHYDFVDEHSMWQRKTLHGIELFEKKSDLNVERNEDLNVYDHRLHAIKKIKIQLVFKTHFQFFSDFLAICFAVLILFKLNSVERLFYPYEKGFRQNFKYKELITLKEQNMKIINL